MKEAVKKVGTGVKKAAIAASSAAKQSKKSVKNKGANKIARQAKTTAKKPAKKSAKKAVKAVKKAAKEACETEMKKKGFSSKGSRNVCGLSPKRRAWFLSCKAAKEAVKDKIDQRYLKFPDPIPKTKWVVISEKAQHCYINEPQPSYRFPNKCRKGKGMAKHDKKNAKQLDAWKAGETQKKIDCASKEDPNTKAFCPAGSITPANNTDKADTEAPADNDDSTDTNAPADSGNSGNSDNADDSNNSDDSSSGNDKNPADSGASDNADESGNAARSPAKIPMSVINFCKTRPKGKKKRVCIIIDTLQKQGLLLVQEDTPADSTTSSIDLQTKSCPPGKS